MNIHTLSTAARSRRTQSHIAHIHSPRQPQPISPLSRKELRRIVAEMLG